MKLSIGSKIGIDSAYKCLDPIFRERLSKSDLKHFTNGYNQAVQDMADELVRKGITSIDCCAEGKCVKIEDIKKPSQVEPEEVRVEDGFIVKTIRIRIF